MKTAPATETRQSPFDGHTPGPWWRDDDGFIAAGSGDTYVTVASQNCSDMDIDDREANAALIAAAPRLLTERDRLAYALEAIVDGACWSLSGPRSHLAEIDSEKIEKARAALATLTD